jgi:mevalonate kinase
MEITASAPGKAILFGEHAVVYGKPAIAVAVDRKAYVTLKKREDKRVHVKINDLNLSGFLDLEKSEVKVENLNKKPEKKGILNYILSAVLKVQKGALQGMDIEIDLEIPIGAGLGSSAAITVATIAAVSKFNRMELSKDEIAEHAHNVELEVQGAASHIDTTLSTYGGMIYLSKNAEDIKPIKISGNLPLVVGYTEERGNTGELVESVKLKKETYPEAVNPILNAIESVTDDAVDALLEKDEKRIGELMNINHGLLDALGVNTGDLSRMAYTARRAGALGSKITGAGGGGSIIAYCPGKVEEVIKSIKKMDKAFNAALSVDGVKVKVKK